MTIVGSTCVVLPPTSTSPTKHFVPRRSSPFVFRSVHKRRRLNVRISLSVPIEPEWTLGVRQPSFSTSFFLLGSRCFMSHEFPSLMRTIFFWEKNRRVVDMDPPSTMRLSTVLQTNWIQRPPSPKRPGKPRSPHAEVVVKHCVRQQADTPPDSSMATTLHRVMGTMPPLPEPISFPTRRLFPGIVPGKMSFHTVELVRKGMSEPSNLGDQTPSLNT